MRHAPRAGDADGARGHRRSIPVARAVWQADIHSGRHESAVLPRPPSSVCCRSPSSWADRPVHRRPARRSIRFRPRELSDRPPIRHGPRHPLHESSSRSAACFRRAPAPCHPAVLRRVRTFHHRFCAGSRPSFRRNRFSAGRGHEPAGFSETSVESPAVFSSFDDGPHRPAVDSASDHPEKASGHARAARIPPLCRNGSLRVDSPAAHRRGLMALPYRRDPRAIETALDGGPAADVADRE